MGTPAGHWNKIIEDHYYIPQGQKESVKGIDLDRPSTKSIKTFWEHGVPKFLTKHLALEYPCDNFLQHWSRGQKKDAEMSIGIVNHRTYFIYH